MSAETVLSFQTKLGAQNVSRRVSKKHSSCNRQLKTLKDVKMACEKLRKRQPELYMRIYGRGFLEGFKQAQKRYHQPVLNRFTII